MLNIKLQSPIRIWRESDERDRGSFWKRFVYIEPGTVSAVKPNTIYPRFYGRAFIRFGSGDTIIAIIPLNFIIRWIRLVYFILRYPRVAWFEKRDPAWFGRKLSSYLQRIVRLQNDLAGARVAALLAERAHLLRSERWARQKNALIARSNSMQRVIAALITQSGGEIRIPQSSLDELALSPVKIVSFTDQANGELVFKIENQPTCRDCGLPVETGDVCPSCQSNPVIEAEPF